MEQAPQYLDEKGNPADAPQYLDASGNPVDTKPQPVMRRSRTGALYAEPEGHALTEGLEGLASNFDPRNYVAMVKHAIDQPIGQTVQDVALSPFRLAGRLITDPARTSGEVMGGVVAGELPGIVRGRLAPKVPTGDHLDLTKVVKPGDLTREQLAERMAAIDKAGGIPAATREAARQRNNPMRGRIIARRDIAPDAPVAASPTEAVAPTIEDAQAAASTAPMPTKATLRVTRAAEPPTDAPMSVQDMRRYYGAEDAGQFLMPDQPKAGEQLVRDVAPGPHRNPLVKEMAELDEGYRYGINNPRGEISLSLLKMLGLSGRAVTYPMAYRYGGGMGVAAHAALDAGQLAIQHPVGSAEALRAAILARLAAQEPDVAK